MNPDRNPATIEREIEPSGEAGMATIEVVIIDRNADVRDGLSAILGSRDDIHVLAATATADEGVRELPDASPAVVLVDAQVPEGDGVGEIRRVRECWPRTKVIALAVHSSATNAALAAGADRVVMKDSSRQLLLDAVRAATGPT